MVKKKAQADEAAAAAQKAARVTRQKVKIDMNLDKPVQNESHVEAESESVTARIKKRKRSSISQGNESSTTPKKNHKLDSLSHNSNGLNLMPNSFS